jgi:hypothetical protein
MVLSDQWTILLAAITPALPQFVLTLDDAKAKTAAAQAAAAVTSVNEPQLGGLADLLGQGGYNKYDSSKENLLGLEHGAYGSIWHNPGEVVAIIKAMEDLGAMGNKESLLE